MHRNHTPTATPLLPLIEYFLLATAFVALLAALVSGVSSQITAQSAWPQLSTCLTAFFLTLSLGLLARFLWESRPMALLHAHVKRHHK